MHVWGKMRESHAKYVKLYRSESGEIKGNFKKISKFSSSYCRYSLVDCLHSRNKTLAKVVGNYRREDVSVTWSCPVSVESLSLLQINRHGSFLVCHITYCIMHILNVTEKPKTHFPGILLLRIFLAVVGHTKPMKSF